ncbi:MAG: hypothetical protein RLZZ142_1052 [Verrucomicrobiota bacterium]
MGAGGEGRGGVGAEVRFPGAQGGSGADGGDPAVEAGGEDDGGISEVLRGFAVDGLREPDGEGGVGVGHGVVPGVVEGFATGGEEDEFREGGDADIGASGDFDGGGALGLGAEV